MKNKGWGPDNTNSIEKIREHCKKEIIVGSRLPLPLINKDLGEDQIAIEMALFRHEVSTKRKRLQDTMERVIFPLVLKKEWDLDHYSRFIIRGLI